MWWHWTLTHRLCRMGRKVGGNTEVQSVTVLDWYRQKLHLAENAEPEEQPAS